MSKKKIFSNLIWPYDKVLLNVLQLPQNWLSKQRSIWSSEKITTVFLQFEQTTKSDALMFFSKFSSVFLMLSNDCINFFSRKYNLTTIIIFHNAGKSTKKLRNIIFFPIREFLCDFFGDDIISILYPSQLIKFFIRQSRTGSVDFFIVKR